MACPLEDVASSNGGGNINSSSYIILYIYISLNVGSVGFLIMLMEDDISNSKRQTEIYHDLSLAGT